MGKRIDDFSLHKCLKTGQKKIRINVKYRSHIALPLFPPLLQSAKLQMRGNTKDEGEKKKSHN